MCLSISPAAAYLSASLLHLIPDDSRLCSTCSSSSSSSRGWMDDCLSHLLQVTSAHLNKRVWQTSPKHYSSESKTLTLPSSAFLKQKSILHHSLLKAVASVVMQGSEDCGRWWFWTNLCTVPRWLLHKQITSFMMWAGVYTRLESHVMCWIYATEQFQ